MEIIGIVWMKNGGRTLKLDMSGDSDVTWKKMIAYISANIERYNEVTEHILTKRAPSPSITTIVPVSEKKTPAIVRPSYDTKIR